MKRLIYTFRYLTRNRGNNLIRILSMTLGLVVGAILLSQVAFDTSFDRFYPDADRIYQARFVWVGENEDDVADGLFGEPWSVLRDELPGTVSGTMFFPQRNLRPFYYEDHPHVFQGLYHADSVFFDFFGVKLTQGDLRSGFQSDRNIFLSGSCAERMFGGRNPVGEIVFYDKSAPYTVAGVFEDFPKNSTLSFDALIPLRNIAPFTDINGWRPNMKWGGTDCFRGYVKLVPEANPDSVNADLRKICRKYADTDEVFYRLYPVTQLHRDNADVRHHVFIRSLLAFIVLLVAAMNYALASISSLATRARTMAMYKCNGNTSSGIFGMMLSETAILILLSMLLAVLLVFSFRQPIQQIITTPFSAIFTAGNLTKTLAVIIPLFLIAGVIPAKIFSSIPVALAFRNYALNKRLWKQFLLFIQFGCAALMITLLAIVVRQYRLVLHKDPGFRYENLVFVRFPGLDPAQADMLKHQLGKLPAVQVVCFASGLPGYECSGDNISEEATGRGVHIFAYGVDSDFIPAMEIRVASGRNFGADPAGNEIIVNEELVEKMQWTDSPIGKTVLLFQTPRTIVGVVENFYNQPLIREPNSVIHPSVLMPATGSPILIAKLDGITPEKLSEIRKLLTNLFPSTDITVDIYREVIRAQYENELHFRNTVFVGVIVTLLISLIGLVGYTNNEIQRRSKEIAIRKVNGATASSIVRLIARDLQWITLAALVAGFAGAYLIGGNWLLRFATKTPLNIGLFAGCGLTVCAIIAVTVILKTRRTACENPVKSIKKE